MVALVDLWLPILLSAVFVFIASSVLHMAIPIHKGDFKKLDKEDEVLASLRSAGVRPGEYMFPCAGSMKEMGTPEMQAKLKQGPVGTLIVLPGGGFNMGKCLGLWFVYTIVVSFFVAYLAALVLPVGATYSTVFRFTGTAAILGYALSNIPNSIWKGVSWSTTAKFIFDGVVYGLVTAGTFGWQWPKVM